ncbi:hypothetical protein [Pseudomonas sp.]|uniref:hypothetical protein n=1 Tax=Pseudomonas sp. TaxID=306 RepID=UPI003A969C42
MQVAPDFLTKLSGSAINTDSSALFMAQHASHIRLSIFEFDEGTPNGVLARPDSSHKRSKQ